MQHTSNDGQTWQTVAKATAQEDITPLFVFDGQTAWYTTTNTQTFATTALHRTGDGGQTWTTFLWISPTQFLDNISIFDQQFAWVSTVDNSGSQPVFHLYLVGGSAQSWHEVTPPGQNQIDNLYFLSQQVGWVAEQTTDGTSQALFMTSDGGQTWTQQTPPLPAGVPATDTLNILFPGFGDAMHGYLRIMYSNPTTPAVDAEQFYATADGGASWQTYGASEPGRIEAVSQIDSWHLTTADPIVFTLKGAIPLGILRLGQWHTQHVHPPQNTIEALLTPLTNNTMFVSSFNSTNNAQLLYETRDGGTTWQLIATVPFSV